MFVLWPGNAIDRPRHSFPSPTWRCTSEAATYASADPCIQLEWCGSRCVESCIYSTCNMQHAAQIIQGGTVLYSYIIRHRYHLQFEAIEATLECTCSRSPVIYIKPINNDTLVQLNVIPPPPASPSMLFQMLSTIAPAPQAHPRCHHPLLFSALLPLRPRQ